MYTFLTSSTPFPSVDQANDEGIIAVGGDLSPSRLITAYKSGIFPWFSEDEPIIWWSPDPRFILIPEKLHISKSMHKVAKSGKYSTTRDHDFKSVINACRTTTRAKQQGTWITKHMQDAYIALHEQGYAHSIETWHNDKLVGGLYGIAVGSCFCGESMFAIESNASKVALISLVDHLTQQGFQLIDSQVHNDHMESLGAELIPRSRFMHLLNECLESDVKW